MATRVSLLFEWTNECQIIDICKCMELGIFTFNKDTNMLVTEESDLAANGIEVTQDSFHSNNKSLRLDYFHFHNTKTKGDSRYYFYKCLYDDGGESQVTVYKNIMGHELHILND